MNTPHTKTRRSLQLALAMRPIEKSVVLTAHYGPSVMENLEIPMVNGGDTIPSLSQCVDADFALGFQ